MSETGTASKPASAEQVVPQPRTRDLVIIIQMLVNRLRKRGNEHEMKRC
jgi:hypothetical protein